MPHIEGILFTRTEEPCKHCREFNPVAFGGQTVRYTVLAKGTNMVITDFRTGMTDTIGIDFCPKCGRYLKGRTRSR
jgi:hypothetical protein